MHAHQRLDALRDLLAESGTVTVSEVARRWRVSEMTIRRDLRRLSGLGLAARVHGGAVAGGGLNWQVRKGRNPQAKATAASKLLRFLPDEGCIYLDGSTTVFALAQALAGRGGLTVATNNVDTFQELARHPGLEAVLVGGRLNRDTDNCVGPIARRCLEGLSFRVAFCSAFALHARHGCCEPALDDAEVKRCVCERADLVCVAVDHAKLDRQAAGTWIPVRDRAVLATDLPPRDRRLAPFHDRFSRIV